MSVKNYKYNSKIQITKNFNSNEFQCKGKWHNHDVKVDVYFINKLQEFMNKYGYDRSTISSGYRCQIHNKNVGGASSSQHTKGRAVDICFYKSGTKVLAKEICCKSQDYGFKGIAYIDKYHVHLDNRLIGKYRGDERKGYSNNIPNGDFYKYFNISKYILTRILKRGSKGVDVKELQQTLNVLKYKSGNIDGIFGVNTEKAVKQFQKDNKLKNDGIVGKNTAHKLGWTFKDK